jgi:hypothetical protein
MDRISITPLTHFHLRGKGNAFMDAESFDALPEAVLCAVTLANSGVIVSVEEVSGKCPVCTPKTPLVN